MENKIKILDESVSNIIAAGEVVENPAAMIKEFIENSLDAKATSIKIYIKNSGRYVKIVDNGIGMTKNDLFLCIERHATSKISNKDDIFNLSTYGFRGEALASIAAVSKLKISSKIGTEKVGNEISIYGGKIRNSKEVSKNMGTEIEVKDLFYNTPVRLKFLKSKQTEYGKIKDVAFKEALSNYNVSFELHIDEKRVLFTTGNGIENTILELLGKNILKNLKKFKYGYLGNMDILKNSKSYIFTFFNKRYAKSLLVEKAVLEGYYTKLIKGKFPVAIIFYEISPNKIDVNIHPSKKIVKFENEKEVFKDIKTAVEEAIGTNEEEMLPNVIFNNEERNDSAEYKESDLEKSNEPSKNSYNDNRYEVPKFEENKLFNSLARNEMRENVLIEKSVDNKIDLKGKIIDRVNIEKSYKNYEENTQKKEGFYGVKEPEKEYNKLERNYKLLGQLNNMYILIEKDNKLSIYDQHIVHERILYEELKEKFYNNKLYSRELLVPISVEVNIKEKEAIFENLENFKKIGFEIEEFGENEILIRNVPEFEFRESFQNIFFEILKSLMENSGVKDIREKIIISMSCKGAIKAGQILTREAMYELVDKLHKIGKYTCPHGRPIIINISFDELERKFRRK
ncbi:DNA mismatch repair endonuclease MutL [Haliovirga abyssi]|uniref:DNA mismatch repair protein MutL n=1 Tax=Haliovirga abyssi TaxID=2996794 RepID=A0AAU9DQ62_9FUSO|nr:DNA mismatch repair endonuclease MutL [Haliovirga abyssi]BDU50593.1 DNA mismatch repair protein MutL [Haliovirga abyssi]